MNQSQKDIVRKTVSETDAWAPEKKNRQTKNSRNFPLAIHYDFEELTISVRFPIKPSHSQFQGQKTTKPLEEQPSTQQRGSEGVSTPCNMLGHLSKHWNQQRDRQTAILEIVVEQSSHEIP